MHPIARHYHFSAPTEVTAIRISNDQQVSAVLTSPPVNAFWLKDTLHYGNQSGSAGDYLVQYQDGERSIVPASVFQNTYEATEAAPNLTTQQARYNYSLIAEEQHVKLLASMHIDDDEDEDSMPVAVHTRLSREYHDELCAEFPNILSRNPDVEPYGLTTTNFDLRVKHRDFIYAIKQLQSPQQPATPFRYPLDVSFRTSQGVVHAINESKNFTPQVTYLHQGDIIPQATLIAATRLMAQVFSEENNSVVEPLKLWTVPIQQLDALGRTIVQAWIHDTIGSSTPNVKEPELHYPEPGLTGHLALWGLDPKDILTKPE